LVLDKRSQLCTWCREPKSQLTRDRVFPRCLGGTEDLNVPACLECQTRISLVEEEVSRRSLFAFYRIDRGPPPRHKGKPYSGSVEAKYILVKDWMGGYNEVALRAKQNPIPLPRIELDVTSLNARVHGAMPEDVNRLVEAILRIVEGPPDKSGFLGEVTVELLSEADADIVSDPDFWPRVFLDLRGRLKIRAHDGEEAKQLFEAIVKLAQLGTFKDHSKWPTGQVPAGTSHRFCLEWDEHAVLRVVAKIAYATAYLQALPQLLGSESLHRVRRFVLDDQDDDGKLPVQQISLEESITEWPNHHVVLIESYNGQLRGIVVLYGACFVVDLGKDPLPTVFAKPVVAMSCMDGTHSYLAAEDETEIVVKKLRCHIEQFNQ